MWEALRDRARFIPVPRLVTVLVTRARRRELLVDDVEAHHDFQGEEDFVDILDHVRRG